MSLSGVQEITGILYLGRKHAVFFVEEDIAITFLQLAWIKS